MTTVLACDQSSRLTGWCYAGTAIPLETWKCGHFNTPKRDDTGERLIIIEDSMLALIDCYHPDLVVIEEPYSPLRELLEAARGGKQNVRGGYNLDTMNLLQMVKGTILMAAARRSVPTESYPPRSWRTALKLPTRPKGAPVDWVKKQTVAAVRRLGAAVKSQDEADAWGLAFYSLHGKAGVERATTDLFEKLRATL